MSTHTIHAENHKKEAIKYTATLVALLILTIITVAASYIDFGPGNIVIALSIATVKATIVALVFMHLLHDKPVNGVIAAAGFIFLGILLGFCMMDTGTRRDPRPINYHPMNVGAPTAPPAAPTGNATAPKE